MTTMQTARKPRRVTKRAPRSRGMFTPDEFIRVAPVHHPKPAIALGDLGRRQVAGAGELFDGKPHPAPATALLTYRGGPLLTSVQVFSVYWGRSWGTVASAKKLVKQLDTFFTDIVASAAIDQLAEYNVPGQKIGHGSFTGSKVITANAPAASITDSSVKKQVKAWIKAGTVPKNNKNSLYFIFLEPGIVSILGGTRSCQSFCGYHNNTTGGVYYAVMPYPSCAGCLGGMSALDALTGTSSHELCEAITDPVPGKGWYDDANGEIGDICGWRFKHVAGHNVQLEWSNVNGKCV